MFIELHIIQSFPPTNLNRDDMNQPKDCEFGGVRRARISSQCLKRATRRAPVFAATTKVDNGFRSRLLARRLIFALKDSGKPQAQVQAVARAIAGLYTDKTGQMDRSNPERTKVQVYLSQSDADWTVNRIQHDWDALVAALQPTEQPLGTEKRAKGAKAQKVDLQTSAIGRLVSDLIELTKGHSDAPDIALFGRMLADRPDTNILAACQVGHAVSTHALKMDLDFFTAVDELSCPEETGAAMMDVAGFNSACFYRYARLDWLILKRNLGAEDESESEVIELARRTVEAFLRASEAATPTGMQSGHDNHSRPAFMLAVVRAADSPGWSLVNAFEKPVEAWSGSGLVEPSILALDHYWNGLIEWYGTGTVVSTAVAALPAWRPQGLSQNLADAIRPNFEAWVQAVVENLP